MKPFEAPEVVEKTADEIESIIASIKASHLPEPTQRFVIQCIQLACWLPHLLQKKNISLSRLKAMLFGTGYRGQSGKKKKGGGSGSSGSDGGVSGSGSVGSVEPEDGAGAKSSENEGDNVSSSPNKRQGRNPHSVYQHFESHWLRIEDYQAGDKCPEGCGGRLYALPCGVVVRVMGQPIAQPVKYYVEKLRCNVCQYALSAVLPRHVGKEKYTPTFSAQLALHKFYLGVPYYRLAQYQQLVGCPLPDSTQWDIIERLGGACYGVFQTVQRLAANGPLIHNDDSYLRILEVIAELKRADNPCPSGKPV